MDLKSFIEAEYSNPSEAFGFLNVLLIKWKIFGKSQRFGQYLESNIDGLSVPENIFYTEDFKVVCSWCSGIVFEIYIG